MEQISVEDFITAIKEGIGSTIADPLVALAIANSQLKVCRETIGKLQQRIDALTNELTNQAPPVPGPTE